jgi:NADH-quinone oxidoreductase subunit F
VDVRLLDAEPTAVERDAVDAFLGPSLAIWTGTDAIENGHAAHGGHAVRAQRHLLLPTLHALHERAGWISPGGLNYVARRLTVPPADVYGVATFYALFSVEERPPRVVHVCDDIACRCAGSEELIAQLGTEGEAVDGATWLRAPCLGQCDRAPAA